ncbi:MAG TPA: hypothetical protein VFW77_00490 [Candidatus Saccharimonadales bacterium]|nr:hypothetical protein [Candidatus Saccharimonadales bacterium]
MKEQLPHGPLKNTNDLEAVKAALGIEQEVSDTHPRFNLVMNRAVARDVVDGEIEDGGIRLLIVHEDETSDDLAEKIEAAGLPHLEKLKVVDTAAPPEDKDRETEGGDQARPGERFTLYMVPSNAKRMSNERLFPGRQSTETYVSDSELFRDLGTLWRGIADATGKLPPDSLLEHTGMQDFSHDRSRLFPIPLFRFWEDIGDEEPVEKFGKILEAELKDLYPSSDHDQISELYQVAMAGFERE